VVESVGEGVTEFKAGDRVGAFHQMVTPGGSYAEYAIAWAYTTFHIPEKTTFEEAATIPLAAMTAAVGLYQDMRLPLPFTPATNPIPLVVYGGSSAVGAFAIKLASLSNIHPIIAVAGGGASYVETLIDRSKGDTIVDYRKGDEAVVSGIKEAVAKGNFGSVKYAYDAVSEKNSYLNLGKAMDIRGQICLVLPTDKYEGLSQGLVAYRTKVAAVHSEWKDLYPDGPEAAQQLPTGGKDFGFAMFRLFGFWLDKGLFSGHPHKVFPKGLEGIEEGLTALKDGKISAQKCVFRISETPGVGK
jgi:NADPH:quinone reductase